MSPGLLLAIETSCDDTCAAVLDGQRILSNVISSQAAAHEGFGGVVPEVAARHHLELATPVVEAALGEAGVSLDDVEAVAATAGPGLIGALLVGISTAKGIAAAREHQGYELLGQTLDDAAGEAFDKSARLLGLGYPGGPAVQREAEAG